MPSIRAVPSRARRLLAVALWAAAAAAGCRLSPGEPELSAAQRAAIADTIRALIPAAYDLSRAGAVDRMLGLYPARGPVVSASAGHITTSRDTLAMAIRTFWQYVGQNMRDPRWTWDRVYVDVLSLNAAVLTGTYRIAHRTPQGMSHTVGGAWTAVFERRDGRWVIVQEHLSDAPVAMDSMPGM